MTLAVCRTSVDRAVPSVLRMPCDVRADAAPLDRLYERTHVVALVRAQRRARSQMPLHQRQRAVTPGRARGVPNIHSGPGRGASAAMAFAVAPNRLSARRGGAADPVPGHAIDRFGRPNTSMPDASRSTVRSGRAIGRRTGTRPRAIAPARTRACTAGGVCMGDGVSMKAGLEPTDIPVAPASRVDGWPGEPFLIARSLVRRTNRSGTLNRTRMGFFARQFLCDAQRSVEKSALTMASAWTKIGQHTNRLVRLYHDRVKRETQPRRCDARGFPIAQDDVRCASRLVTCRCGLLLLRGLRVAPPGVGSGESAVDAVRSDP